MEQNVLPELWQENFPAGTSIQWFDRNLKAWVPGKVLGFHQMEGFDPVMNFKLDSDKQQCPRFLTFDNRCSVRKQTSEPR